MLNIALAILGKQEKRKKVLGQRMNNKLWVKNYFINGVYEYEEWNSEGHFRVVRNKWYKL